MNFEHLRHIVIEGPIGAGKTTLANKLAHRLEARPLLEQPEQNPFLPRFYKEGARYALPTQLFFLFQRLHQLQDVLQTDMFERSVVADFLLEKDPLFAQLTLSDDELQLYQTIYQHQSPQIPTPDLVIYLQAKPETLIERVLRRGLPYEAAISENYLRRLSESYSRFFHHYDTAPLLIMNTENINPADNEEDFELLLSRIEGMRSRREFFNRSE